MEDCRNCGACCLEVPLYECDQRFYDTNKDLLEFRGLTFRRIKDRIYVMTQKCKHLEIANGLYLCTIQETKPQICRDQQQGSRECLEAKRIKEGNI